MTVAAAPFAIQAALAGGSAIAGFRAQSVAARATRRSALDSFARQSLAVRRREAETERARAEEFQRLQLTALEQAGSILAGAATSGVAGEAVRGVLRDLSRKALEASTVNFLQAKQEALQAEDTLSALRSQLQGRLASARKPSAFALALGVAGSTIAAFGSNTRINPETGIREFVGFKGNTKPVF